MKSQTSKYHLAARDIADLVVKKQACYGDSFGKSGGVMKILYPDGIKTAQLDDALVIVRIIDKLFRIVTDKDALGESPYKDILGYALLAVIKNCPIENIDIVHVPRVKNWHGFNQEWNKKISKALYMHTHNVKKPSKKDTRMPTKASKRLTVARKPKKGGLRA